MDTIAEYRWVVCPSCGGEGYHTDPEIGAYGCGCHYGQVERLFEPCDDCDGTGERETTVGGDGFADADVVCDCLACDATGWVQADE